MITKDAALAAPNSDAQPGITDPASAAQAVGSLALLGGSANWARNTYNRVQPSLLSLGESMWSDPEHLERFRQYARGVPVNQRASVGAAVEALAANKGNLRGVLTGGQLPGHSPHVADAVRQMTFGGTRARYGPHRPKPGDIMLRGSKNQVSGPIAAARTGLVGNNLYHTSILNKDLGGMAFISAKGPVGGSFDVPLKGFRKPDWVSARFRDTQLTPAQRKMVDHAARYAYVPEGKPPTYDFAKHNDLMLRELMPELGTSDGRTMLSRPLDWAAKSPRTSSALKKVLPDPFYRGLILSRKLRARCGPGEVCSTMAGKVLSDVGAPVAANMSPNDVMRQAKPGGRFQVSELNVPKSLRNRKFLLGSHYGRLIPGAMRAPFILAGAGLGLAGLNGAFSGSGDASKPAMRAISPLQSDQPPAAAPPAAAAPWTSFRKHNTQMIGNRVKDVLGDVWTRMQTRYGGPK